MTIHTDLGLRSFQRFWQITGITEEQAKNVLQYLEDEGITERQDTYSGYEKEDGDTAKLRSAFNAGWESCEEEFRSFSPYTGNDFERWLAKNS